MAKIYKGRISQKHDTSENWEKAGNFVPLTGELIIYDDLHKIKIGTGSTKIKDLPFEAVDGAQISGGINSIGNESTTIAINPAINGAGFERYKNSVIKIYYGDYEMPFSTNTIDNLFDGKAKTYINFCGGFAGDFDWNSSKTYPAGAYVKVNNIWYKAISENTNVNPTSDNTIWENAQSLAGIDYSSYINLNDVPIVIDITFSNSIKFENSLALYWRAYGQNPNYIKVEKYREDYGWYTVEEQRDIHQNQTVTNIYLANNNPPQKQYPGSENKMRITMYTRPKQAWFALIQLAITGIYGGIDGTLLNRGGDTMYGSITPYKKNAADLGSNNLPWGYVYASNYKGEASDVISSFNQASTRNNLTSGDTLRTIFGKISKWFVDLGQLAFKNKVSKDDLDSDLQSSLNLSSKKSIYCGFYEGNGDESIIGIYPIRIETGFRVNGLILSYQIPTRIPSDNPRIGTDQTFLLTANMNSPYFEVDDTGFTIKAETKMKSKVLTTKGFNWTGNTYYFIAF